MFPKIGMALYLRVRKTSRNKVLGIIYFILFLIFKPETLY